MADNTQSDDEGGSTRSLRDRKERLASLKERFQALTQSPPAPEPARPTAVAQVATPARPALPGPMRGGRGAGTAWLGQGSPAAAGAQSLLGAIGPQQRMMINRIFQMLTQDAQDGSAPIPGTPFTRSGVEKLMSLLTQRAQDQNAPGSKIAQSALRFIEAHEGEGEAVAGASLEKLQMIAKRAESLKLRGAGRPVSL